MELNERQKEIFDLICENKKMSVSSLAKILYVTEMTKKIPWRSYVSAGKQKLSRIVTNAY